jgi:hypothetical protein
MFHYITGTVNRFSTFLWIMNASFGIQTTYQGMIPDGGQ